MRSDYQEAARWYRKYLAYFPGEPDTANTNFLLAEILYESGDFADAVVEYERTAYDYEVHEHSAEAGYAALLSYVEHEKILETDVKRTWHQQYLHSSLKFADYYPEHPESGAIMTMVAEDLFAQNQFDLAVAVGQAVIGKRPPVEPELARTAWTVVAHSQFDLENFSEAENAYYKLRAVTPAADADAQQEIKDRIASSIYKQGEQARDAGYLEAAVAHFTRLGTVVPDSPIRRTAEYDAAATLINMAAWGRATSVLEQYRRDFPGSEFADDITQKLAATYMESGRGIEAAAEFERMAVADSSSDDVRREALWKAAELYEVGDSSENEQRVLQNIVDRYPDPLAESIEARYRLLVLAEITGDSAQVTRRLQELVDADAGAQRTDRTRYLAATASIRLAEPLRKQFETAKLTQPLAESMKLKRSLMEEVIDAYTSAAEYGVAEVTTESTFRLAEVYEFFGRDLLASERPADLDADALEQYELLLEEQVYPFEEKAIDLYRTNTDRVPDGVWDAWVEKSFNRLAGLMPARYAKLERSEDVVTALY
jgi:TolA-binding protein